MTRDTHTPPSPQVPLVEEPEPALAYSPVEPDRVAATRLFVQISALLVVVVLLLLGVWRLVACQTQAELRRKETSDSQNAQLQMDTEAAAVLTSDAPDPKTGKRRMPIDAVFRAVSKDPGLLGPLAPAPTPKDAPRAAPASTPKE